MPSSSLSLALLPAAAQGLAGLRVFAEREAAAPWGRLVLRVIGESSLVVVEWEAGSLAELVTCGPTPGGSLAFATLSVGPGSNAALAAGGVGFAYAARAWAAPPAATGPEAEFPLSLEYRFPGGEAPATVIAARPGPGGLALRTRHDYPEHGTSVWTESDWRLTPRGREGS